MAKTGQPGQHFFCKKGEKNLKQKRRKEKGKKKERKRKEKSQ
jgi:hypothetical protein